MRGEGLEKSLRFYLQMIVLLSKDWWELLGLVYEFVNVYKKRNLEMMVTKK